MRKRKQRRVSANNLQKAEMILLRKEERLLRKPNRRKILPRQPLIRKARQLLLIKARNLLRSNPATIKQRKKRPRHFLPLKKEEFDNSY